MYSRIYDTIPRKSESESILTGSCRTGFVSSLATIFLGEGLLVISIFGFIVYPALFEFDTQEGNLKSSGFGQVGTCVNDHFWGKIMAFGPGPSSSIGISYSWNWVFMTCMLLLSAIFSYLVYDAVMATASELLQRLLTISPLLIVIAVHWLSTMPSSSCLSFLLPGSNPDDIHRVGGSPWGIAFVLIVVFVLISYQPSLPSVIS